MMKSERDAFDYMVLIGHIFNSVINLVFGVIIGVILHTLLNLFVTNWIAGVFAVILSVVMLLALFAMETIIGWLFEHVFPNGIRPAKKTATKKPKPLIRRLAMPGGFVLGLLIVELDLTDLEQVNQVLEFLS